MATQASKRTLSTLHDIVLHDIRSLMLIPSSALVEFFYLS